MFEFNSWFLNIRFTVYYNKRKVIIAKLFYKIIFVSPPRIISHNQKSQVDCIKCLKCPVNPLLSQFTRIIYTCSIHKNYRSKPGDLERFLNRIGGGSGMVGNNSYI